MIEFVVDTMPTPAGHIFLVIDRENRLRALDFLEFEQRMMRLLRTQYKQDEISLVRSKSPASVRHLLTAYFNGVTEDFSGVCLKTGGTAFQQAVWAALRKIPYGETVSYGEIAKRIGRPKAMRAVGAANGANPIAIIVPCHRVIGSNGSLTGYGGGLPRKEWLLAHENGERPSPLA